METDILVQFTDRELMYMKNSKFLPESISETLRMGPVSADRRRLFKFTRANAEMLRTELMDRLDIAGFDAHYDLTKEGKLLQEMIDRIFAELTAPSR